MTRSTRNCPSSTCPHRPKGSPVVTGRTIPAKRNYAQRTATTSLAAVPDDAHPEQRAVALHRAREDRVVLDARPEREVPAERLADAPLVERAGADERLHAVGARVLPALRVERRAADAELREEREIAERGKQ